MSPSTPSMKHTLTQSKLYYPIMKQKNGDFGVKNSTSAKKLNKKKNKTLSSGQNTDRSLNGKKNV
jgi:hypothetical protein